jgi:hypothetical protein
VIGRLSPKETMFVNGATNYAILVPCDRKVGLINPIANIALSRQAKK